MSVFAALWSFCSLVCYVFLCFVTYPFGALGEVWYLIVLLPNRCILPYLTLSDLFTLLSIIILYSFVYVFLHSSWALPPSFTSLLSHSFSLD